MPFHINRKDAESGKEPKRFETSFIMKIGS